ncbi:hypothetical protein Bca52824_025045 [Brassica carinata]|uniref:SURP motif domain-containing protein n=1 Tax=Brassica carinata TaxID=52824 RepID=A0A8X7VKR8_BRACI|nr:hypothetical protein Bca52824_025045 [Brassica carinata]
MAGTEGEVQYLLLEPAKVPEALKFYADAFQAKLVDDDYEDQSVQLKLLNSGFLRLSTDLNSIRRIRQDKRFVEIDRTEYEGVMMKDPFGVSFLLIEKKKMTWFGDDPVHFFRRMRKSIAFAFPSCISPSELCTIKLTALFVTWYGMAFRNALNKIASTDQFGFLKVNHSRSDLFFDFVGVYHSILGRSKEVDRSNHFMGKTLELFFHMLQLEKVKMGVSRRSVMEVDAFTGGVDYFAYKDVVGYSEVMPKPERRSVMIAQLEEQTLRTPLSVPFPSWCSTIFFVSPEVLGIIKLTAVFAARYGKRIRWELMEEEEVVKKNPLFSFLDPSDYGFPCYNMVVKAYSKVLKNFELVYRTDFVLQRYFKCLDELKDNLDDVYSFVECVDSFAQLEDEEFYHKMGNREAYVTPLDDRTAMIHHRTHVYPFHDPTSLVQRRREHGSSNIEVCVPTMDGRVIIEITVESFFWEKVSSLKEKIVKVIQIPSKNLKLRGKSVGVLREDTSLAENNVEAGEILTATWRFPRWEV